MTFQCVFSKMFFRRFLCSRTTGYLHRNQWPVKQVTKSNFSEALSEFEDCIANSDFIAVSLQKTGGYAAPWQKILPIDTAETAYIKAKHSAERFQILQFSVCPFSVKMSKLIAHPYNFQLFPREEWKVGMPSYSFSCQSSYLTSMAREGFDFNACIYNGISYLSRAQESAAKVETGHLLLNRSTMQSSSVYSVADTIFRQRIKIRVQNWVSACTKTNEIDDILLSSLRKVVSKIEVCCSRPSLTIDVCSERQVELALEVLKDFVNIVPLQVPGKVGVHAVRVVLASSEEDKDLFMKEIQEKEREQRRIFRGFQEVIDLISTSQRPVVVHNSLNDFAFIHSKFLAPLPPTMDEFTSSFSSVFPHILDVNHLMKEIGPFDKVNNLPAAISYLDTRFNAPVSMDISNRADSDEVNINGHNVLRICLLFVKLCSILKISLDVLGGEHCQLSSFQCYSNVISPCSTGSRDPTGDNVKVWTGRSRSVSTDSLIFLWGFQSGTSARNLKDLLCDSHDVFSEEFDVKMVDRTCAIIVFWSPGFAESFLRIMDSGENLKDVISEGLKAASFETYKSVFELGFWKPDLADCLEQAMDEIEMLSGAKSMEEQSTICWNSDEMINLDDL